MMFSLKSEEISAWVSALVKVILFASVFLLRLDSCALEDYSDVARLKQSANTSFWLHDYKAAQKDVIDLLAYKMSQPEKARCLVNLAFCQSQLADWKNARKNSALAIKLALPDSREMADALGLKAHCDLLDGKIRKALLDYQTAINVNCKIDGDWNCDLAPLYEGLAACYVHKNELCEAEKYYKKVAQLDYLKYGPDSTYFAWSLLSLSHCEKSLGNCDVADCLYKKVIWNFRYQNEERISSELIQSGNQNLVESLRSQLYGYTGGIDRKTCGLFRITEGIPKKALQDHLCRTHDFDNWFKERLGRERAPGLAFFDPSRKLKALIVTVHGLGLHQGAYIPFATRIEHEGFGVISFDVRGFGSYQNDEILQRLDLNAAVDDLCNLLRELKADYPKTPIILLGESMGGAIVLRIAALEPDLISAVISSVPSGSRYQGKKTAVLVGLKLLEDKNAQFNIGHRVIEQATGKANLRDMWEGDPNVRLKLSASELLNFQKFMAGNIKFASKIEKTPVIIFQGYSDNLVKPMGTLAIYQNIPNRDKDLVFIGRAEHLIFEEGQFDADTYNALLAWINRHISTNEEATNEPLSSRSL